ncbi:intracellular protease, PfpI family [Caldithrix abyssi DSM 13497]|uniref:Intracellular protease, PfpI family n=1 Tax=Caldithrix abyssi DSM 13497 TaxID=880073 RepID=H1XTV5_CALAY|nr:type 1 glutamine amidotransferase domain-containing protein [Caldithrix abyssi]APF18743.1 protease I [Caldithrix abyssi DSM 13497]EHO42722.1 intracellular protease, PfpI family [Caldithrix abyssi DSM 13497]
MSIEDKRILFFVEDLYEDLELWYPKLRLLEAGAKVLVAGPQKGKIYRGKNGYPCQAEAAIDEISFEDFDGLILSGGFAPDKLRRMDKVKHITAEIHQRGKLIAHICHGGWIAISAGIVKGFTCTSTPGIKDDLENAGAKWVDQPVVVDRNMISSRRPDDLPQFCKAIINFYKS